MADTFFFSLSKLKCGAETVVCCLTSWSLQMRSKVLATGARIRKRPGLCLDLSLTGCVVILPLSQLPCLQNRGYHSSLPSSLGLPLTEAVRYLHVMSVRRGVLNSVPQSVST